MLSPGAFHSLPGSLALTALVCVGAILSTRLLFALLDRQRRSVLWLGNEIASLAGRSRRAASISTDEVLAAFLDRLLRALPAEAAAIYLSTATPAAAGSPPLSAASRRSLTPEIELTSRGRRSPALRPRPLARRAIPG